MDSILASIIFGAGGGGGGGGTDSYTDLTDKPKINGVELNGNKSLSNLGLYSKSEVDDLLDDKADASDVYTKTELDEDIEQITTNKTAIEVLNGDDKTEGSVDKKIADAVGDITQFDIKVVVTLPTKGEKGVIYFVPKADAEESDIHDEYIWVVDKFELIGNTKVDLSDYVKKDGTKVLSTNDYINEDKTEVAKIKDKVDIQQKVADAGKVLKIGVDGKLAPAADEKNTIVTSWETTPVDTKVPSEKLVKTELDKKIESIPDDVVRNYTTNNIPYYQLANEYGVNMWHYVIDADGVITFYNRYGEEYTCYLYVFNKQYKKDIFDDLTKNNYILSDKEISWELSEYRPSDTWSPYYTSKGTGTKITIPNHSNIDRISLYITQKVPAGSNYQFKLQNVQTRDTNPLPYMSPFPLGYNKPIDAVVDDCKWPISSSRAHQIYRRANNSAYSSSDTVSRSNAKKYTDDFMVSDFYCWIAEQSGYHRLYMSPDSEDNVYLISMGVGDDHNELVCTILYCSLWYSPFLTVLQYYGEGQVGWAYKDDDDREDFHPTNSRLTNEELVAGPCRLNNTNVSDTGNKNLIWVDIIGHDNSDFEDIRVTVVELGSLY